MKTVITDLKLADILVVCRALPEDEIQQINAFSDGFDPDQMSVSMFNAPGPKWAIRIKETGEPLVVGGLVPLGPCVWRTWFLANQRAWDEYGKEVTIHTARTRKELLKGVDHARIETLCLATRKKACQWYEACGMKYESTMHGYGINGEAAVMYTSTKGARGY